MLREKCLLIITTAFPYKSDYQGIFIKEQVNYLKNDFKKIIIISPLAYFPKCLLISKLFKNFSNHTQYPTDYSYENVSIFFPRYLPLPFRGNIFKKLKIYLFTKAVKDTISKNRIDFDIIHAHFLFPCALVGSLFKNTSKIRLITTAHGGDIYKEPFINTFMFDLTKKSLNDSDFIITTSKRNFEIIKTIFMIPEKKVKIIRNGFDENIFHLMNQKQVRISLKIPENKKIILSIGNLVEIKGHKYLIDAMNDLTKKRSDLQLIIIGNGDKSILQKQIENYNLTNVCTIINGVAHEEIPDWINSCDIFVLPSLDEGSPTVISEALSCGKPVIATSVGAIPELIINDQLGILVKSKDSKELACAIKIAFEKKWDPIYISEYAKSHLSWNVICKDIVNIYKYY